eukprot:TRINITY_DN2986_c0_g1_i1.p1 TRINITY_DN2986_c0_g1~~TRINITY_DN2986_c0_g1_i1.p1  ORF type:complete len:440 (+),score=116.31 TRINITY_DN2986_c0_g1_i1:174-1322(+)
MKGEDQSKVIPTYQLLNDKGEITNTNDFPSELTREQIVGCYKGMVLLNTVDKVLYEVQRQGAISFYMTNFGEESIHYGSALALDLSDVIYGQYREVGVLMHRGFTVQQMVDQCYSNQNDAGKGRQMPVHYGSKEFNFHTISSPLATQIPQAAGAAYAMKVNGQKSIAVCYFGDGAASEGDFHAAVNFASTLSAPVLFFCRNNKWAISTPSREQYRGDGIAGRGPAYGIDTIRVDGNDFFAVYNATKKAKSFMLEHNRPVLIEAMTYRVGHHSTSDDYTRYREQSEVAPWLNENNPISRLAQWLVAKGWWDEEQNNLHKEDCMKQVLQAKAKAEREAKPHIDHLFTDVYDTIPQHLVEQRAHLYEHLKKYGDKYPLKQYSDKL